MKEKKIVQGEREGRDYSKLTKEMIEEFLEDLKPDPNKKLVLYIWSNKHNELIPYEESEEFDKVMKECYKQDSI